MPTGYGTILGGIPVIADVSFGRSDGPDGTDYWAEVQQIYWVKRDGHKGKPIPQHLLDRAEKADPYFATLTEQVSDYLVREEQYRKECEEAGADIRSIEEEFVL